jgi:RHS repeat-associated protein
LSRDYLGTIRLITDASTNVITRHDYLPFGDEIPAGSAGRGSQFGAGADNINEKFTGQYRDAETGLDYFGARYYALAIGRFLSSDPASLAAVDPSDPQTWNQYAYVRINRWRSSILSGFFSMTMATTLMRAAGTAPQTAGTMTSGHLWHRLRSVSIQEQ